MLLRSFRKSVNQEQVEWPGHTLSRCIYLCRVQELQPLLCNIWCTYYSCAFIWPDTSNASPFTHLQHIQIQNQVHQEPEAELPAIYAWQKLGCHFLQVTLSLWKNWTRAEHSQQHLQWSTRNATHRMRVRKVKDFCPCDSAEMWIKSIIQCIAGSLAAQKPSRTSATFHWWETGTGIINIMQTYFKDVLTAS